LYFGKEKEMERVDFCQRVYECPICKKKFETVKDRDFHLSKEHRDYILTIEDNMEIISKQAKNFTFLDVGNFIDEMLHRVPSVYDTESELDIYFFFFCSRLLLEKTVLNMKKIHPKILEEIQQPTSTYNKLNTIISGGIHFGRSSIVKKGRSLILTYSRILSYFISFFGEITCMFATLKEKNTTSSDKFTKKRKEIVENNGNDPVQEERKKKKEIVKNDGNDPVQEERKKKEIVEDKDNSYVGVRRFEDSNGRVGFTRERPPKKDDSENESKKSVKDDDGTRLLNFPGDKHKTKMCMYWLNGQPCEKTCKFAHGKHELREEICLKYLLGNCTRENCFFAHVKQV
jgi:hypothetical protein